MTMTRTPKLRIGAAAEVRAGDSICPIDHDAFAEVEKVSPPPRLIASDLQIDTTAGSLYVSAGQRFFIRRAR